MTYQRLVQDALSTIDSTETELVAFCDSILAEKQIQIPTPEEWRAFHAYHDRIKTQLTTRNHHARTIRTVNPILN